MDKLVRWITEQLQQQALIYLINYLISPGSLIDLSFLARVESMCLAVACFDRCVPTRVKKLLLRTLEANSIGERAINFLNERIHCLPERVPKTLYIK